MEPKPLGWISRTNLQNDYYAAPQLVLSAYGEYCQTFLTVFTIGSAEDTDISSVGCTNHTVTLRYKNGKERTIDLNYLDSKATIC